MERIKTAIVGCGSISDIYMESFTCGRFGVIELVGCSDLDEGRMKAAAEKYRIAPMTMEEILQDESIALVVNLTTPLAHYTVIRQCLLAGKHVFSEKMIAVDLAEGEELVRLADEKGLRLGVAPDTFLGASVQTAKYIVDAGLIGEPLSCRASVSRNYGVYGEFLPHLYRRGAGIGFDMGGYYLTALAAILGPIKSVAAYAGIHRPERVNNRVGAPLFGQAYRLEVPNVIAAAMQYEGGVLGTLHMNSDCILDERANLEIYGTQGILLLGDPNQFGAPVYLQKTNSAPQPFPFTHGFAENSRGLGAAEMAWSIIAGREHRASKEMALHVFETMHGIMLSAERGEPYRMKHGFTCPRPLPEGYIGDGGWTRKEESALI